MCYNLRNMEGEKMFLLIIIISLLVTCVCLGVYSYYLTRELSKMEIRIDKKIQLNNELRK